MRYIGHSLLQYWIQRTNADCLSQLPLAIADKDTEVEPETVDMPSMEQTEPWTVTKAVVQHETKNDPLLAEIYDIIMNEWTYAYNQLFPAFFS